MKKYNKITPEGTSDLLFEECLVRRYVEKTLASAFSSRGFNEVVTPGLEFYDVFDPAFSGIGQEVMLFCRNSVRFQPCLTLPLKN